QEKKSFKYSHLRHGKSSHSRLQVIPACLSSDGFVRDETHRKIFSSTCPSPPVSKSLHPRLWLLPSPRGAWPLPFHLGAGALQLLAIGERDRCALRLRLGTEVCDPSGSSDGPKHLGQGTPSGCPSYDSWPQCAALSCQYKVAV